MIGVRTRLSLSQYLDRQSSVFLDVLFEKHGLAEPWMQWRDFASNMLQALVGFLRAVPPERLQALVEEIVATEPDLRDRAVDQWGSGAQPYGARWEDLVRCLALDDYAVSNRRLTALEPDLPGAPNIQDALAAEIRRSGLPSAESIVGLLDQSADAFRQVPPKYNACLSNARAALETLAVGIALARQKTAGGNFQADKWGQVMVYLRTSALVTPDEERLICDVYSLISPGAHRPMQVTEEVMVRFGRRMAVSMCYFLVQIHNG